MSDKELRQAVIDALDFEPGVDGAGIGVAVDDGVVTLTGHVRSYAVKLLAESVVAHVKGVSAIALDLHIRYPSDLSLTDEEIGRRAAQLLRWDVLVPRDAVTVEVENGWVKLTGKVRWQFEKVAAGGALKKLAGVHGLTNNIVIASPSDPVDVGAAKKRILAALKRSAELDANAIRVDVHNNTVVLEGKVRAWHEREVAERAAWALPGVYVVDDRLNVG